MNAKPPSPNDKSDTKNKAKNSSPRETQKEATLSNNKPDRDGNKIKPNRRFFRDNYSGLIALFISLFTLLLTMAGLGGGYWVWLQDQHSIEAQKVTINALRQTITDKASAQNLKQLAQKVTQLSQNQQIQSKKISSLEQTFQQIKNLKQRDHQGWVIAEAEYLMRIAQYRLTLLHDPNGAIKALTLADQQLANLNQPHLVPARQAVISEIQSLRDYHPPNKVTILLQLNETMRHLVIQSPVNLGLGNTKSPSNAENRSVSQTNTNGFRGFIEAVWRSISEHINIQHYSRRITNLSAITTQTQTLQSIYVNLENAKTAVLIGDNHVYHRSLSKILQALKNHIANDSTKTGLMTTLHQLNGIDISPQAPTLGKGFSLLSKLSTPNESKQMRKPTS